MIFSLEDGVVPNAIYQYCVKAEGVQAHERKLTYKTYYRISLALGIERITGKG